MLGEIRSAFYLLGSCRKKLLLKKGGRLRTFANSLSCLLLSAPAPPLLPLPFTLILMAPLENLSQLIPISLPQVPASCSLPHPEFTLDHQDRKIDQR